MNQWNDDEPGREYRIERDDLRANRIQRAVMGEDVGSDAYWERLRSLSRGERWRRSGFMTQTLFLEVQNEIRQELPHLNQQEHRIEFIRRMYGPTLAERVRQFLEERATNTS